MNEPFIRNHQYNLIRKQVQYLQHTCQTVSDPRVVESVRHSVESKLAELFAGQAEDRVQRLGKVSALQTAEDFRKYLHDLEPLLAKFPEVTANQIKKLFPKNKKMTMPEFDIDYRYITYLGWLDIATSKLFIVYPYNGRIVGIEGKYTPTHKKGICCLCNRHEQTALFTAVSKSRPANASPDYYKAVGNYVCMNSQECNKQITDVTALERLISEIIRSD